MGNTFFLCFLASLLRRSALRAVERSGECDSTHRGAEPPAGRRATSAPPTISSAGSALCALALRASSSSSATSVLGWAHSARIAFPQLANQDAAEIDRPFLPAWFESHWISDKGFPHGALASLPLDLPIAPDPSHSPSPWIRQACLPAARDLRTVKFCWRLLPQRFVGTNLIVNTDPPIRPALLCPPIARRWPSGFGFHHSMHLLVPSILFGVAWSDEFHANPQGRPPRAQPRKPRRAGRSKRSAVVYPNDPGIAVAPEQAQENSPCRLPPLIRQQSDGQQIATVQVPHRQRFHPLPVSRSKPPFEIYGPYLVAAIRHAQLPQTHPRPAAGTSPGSATQFHLLEPSTNRARRRNELPAVFPDQSSSQLPTAPASMPPPHPANSLQPCRTRSTRRSPRTTGPIQQPLPPFLFEASLPFVAALAADSKYSTQPRHALLGLQGHFYELQSPRHLRKGRP